MKVLVTGAGGFIGRHMLRALADAGLDPIGWTRADVDLHNSEAVASTMHHLHPDLVFHLASGGVDPARQDSIGLVASELAMADNVLRAVPAGAKIIVAGSMAEYGRSGRLREDMRCDPHALYGLAKLAVTLHAIALGRRRSLRLRVARLFGVYGQGEAPHRLYAQLESKLSRGLPVALSDGAQRRDFVLVEDACRAIIDLAFVESDPAGAEIVNVGTGRAVSIAAMCEQVAGRYSVDRSLLGFGQLPRRVTDEDMLEADTTRLERLIGWVPPQHFD